MKKTAAIIQARMGSTRLPGKVLKKIKDKTVLSHVIKRVEQSKKIDEIIIATTKHRRDDPIIKEAKKYGINYYRGSEEDVLSRYYESAEQYDIDTIVRITSDCPLIDPFIIDEIIEFYQKNDYDLVTNAGPKQENRTYPRGMDTEVFSFEILKEIYQNADQKYQREHVTPYIYENSDRISYYKNNNDYSKYRLTLDEKEDLKLIKKVYNNLYKGEHDFYLADIIQLLEENKHLQKINQDIKQKEYKS